MIPSRRLALCLVAQSGTSALHAASFGPPEAAWAACAEVSAQTHVKYLDAPVRRVLSVIPTKYEDMWTGAKGFYKVEPVVADGGQVILYAPHITEISVMHPVIQEIGYHCRDYFLGQWDKFSGYHWRTANTAGSPSRSRPGSRRPTPERRIWTIWIRQRSTSPR
jgi:nickel-dependent lactate racemase